MSITTLAWPLAPTMTRKGRLSIAELAAAAGEARHRRVSRAVDAFCAQYAQQRERDDPEVQPERAVVDVPDVEPESVLPGLVVAPVDLCPAGDPGANLVAARLLGRVQGQILDEQRPRADDAHVPAHDVPQLRQLVEAGASQKPAEPRQPLGIGKRPALRVDRVRHGPELEESK